MMVVLDAVRPQGRTDRLAVPFYPRAARRRVAWFGTNGPPKGASLRCGRAVLAA